jgi:hypothetical protein
MRLRQDRLEIRRKTPPRAVLGPLVRAQDDHPVGAARD